MTCKQLFNIIIVGVFTITALLLIPVDYVVYVPKNYIIPTSYYMYRNLLTYNDIFNNNVMPYIPCVTNESYEKCITVYTQLVQKYEEILPSIVRISNQVFTIIKLNIWPLVKNLSFSTYQYIMVMIPYVMNYCYNIVAPIMSQVVSKW
jgi:hypothetical protein